MSAENAMAAPQGYFLRREASPLAGRGAVNPKKWQKSDQLKQSKRCANSNQPQGMQLGSQVDQHR